ncbi:MAG: type II secretion system F family protein [Spirochaetia bacterium]|nr:type II secretion system F family protein [Spirochaetia bacterium]
MKFVLAALVFITAAVMAYLNKVLRGGIVSAAARYRTYIIGLTGPKTFKLRPDNTIIFQAAAGVLLLLLSFITGLWYVSLLAIPAILLIPAWRASIMKKRYERSYYEGLPGFLESVISCLKAGFSISAALREASSRDRTPVGTEVAQALKKTGLGMGLAEALASIHGRVPIKENEIIFGAIGTSIETGGNITEVLSNILETIRKRSEIEREVKALTSQGVMSGVIAGSLPLFMIGVISLIDPSFMAPLFSTAWGAGLLGIAAAMELTGALLIKKIVDVK